MSYKGDSGLPKVTDEQLAEALDTTRPYTIVVLKAGPRYEAPGPGRDQEVEKVIWAHGKRNLALRLAGLMPIVCPVDDGSGLAGVSVFDATPDDVDRIMSLDPSVQAGVFTYDIHPTRSFPGSMLPS